jgi:hypothetical protein
MAHIWVSEAFLILISMKVYKYILKTLFAAEKYLVLLKRLLIQCRYEVQIGISGPFPKIIISFFKFSSSEDGEETAWASSSTSGLSVSCNQPTTEGSRSNHHSDSDGSSGNTASLQVGQPFYPQPEAKAE